MPHEYHRMKWCLEYHWTPQQYDEWHGSDDFDEWMVMTRTEKEHEQKAEATRRRDEAKAAWLEKERRRGDSGI